MANYLTFIVLYNMLFKFFTPERLEGSAGIAAIEVVLFRELRVLAL